MIHQPFPPQAASPRPRQAPPAHAADEPAFAFTKHVHRFTIPESHASHNRLDRTRWPDERDHSAATWDTGAPLAYMHPGRLRIHI